MALGQAEASLAEYPSVGIVHLVNTLTMQVKAQPGQLTTELSRPLKY